MTEAQFQALKEWIGDMIRLEIAREDQRSRADDLDPEYAAVLKSEAAAYLLLVTEE